MTVEEWLGEENEIGIDIWNKKYRRNNESFDEWVKRVSGGDEEVSDLIYQKKFLFGGRILSNRGIEISDEKSSLSNCYVIEKPKDSIESIYDTCKNLARTYSYGGGCGIDISNLAPNGATVRNQAKKTSGAVSFMDTFSQVTEQICQNGRRGALMISMDCDHPDIEEFVKIKSDLSRVNYANISVKATDDFMEAAENRNDWTLRFERPETGEVIEKTVNAGELFDTICEQNWNYAEPGVLFWDNISRYNLLNNNDEFEYGGVNPCAEEPLPEGGSCLLCAINLAEFVEESDDGDGTTKPRFSYYDFRKTVRCAVRAMNNVLDEGAERHPLDIQKDASKNWRQIGIGIMGLADALIKLGIKYGSRDALDFCNDVGFDMAVAALSESASEAMFNGAYPNYDERVLESSFYRAHDIEEIDKDFFEKVVKKYGFRNSQLLTIAPTGSISTMLGVSGGIEPIFANHYMRTTKSLHGSDVQYKVYTPIVESYMKKHGLSDDKELPEYFVTSADITPHNRVAMQAIFQRHIDASISSTVNLPNDATVQDIKDIYMIAWKEGLKGITVFREGCARTAILNKDDANNHVVANTAKSDANTNKTIGVEHHLNTGCGSLHVCAFFDEDGNLNNTYLSKGSTGGCNNFMIGLSRMISLAARNGVSIEDIVDQLGSCGTCPSYAVRNATKHDVSPGSSCPVAIGKALSKMSEDAINIFSRHTESEGSECDKNIDNYEKCPECGGELKHEMGCVTCTNCGWSRCG